MRGQQMGGEIGNSKLVYTTKGGVKKETPNTGGSDYKTLETVEAVLVRVPKKDGPYFVKQSAHSFIASGKDVEIPEHFRHGLKIGNVILNRLFFGLIETDFGRMIVAKVEVVEKTTSSGAKYILLNFHKIKNAKAPLEIKISDKLLSTEDIRIIGTNPAQYIHFKAVC
ncbi:MAG: hypothetical protein WC460_02365 [Patescibacteria group bacterium]